MHIHFEEQLRVTWSVTLSGFTKLCVTYFPAKCSYKNCNISVQFVEIKCVEHDQALQNGNTDVETDASCFNKIVILVFTTCPMCTQVEPHGHVYHIGHVYHTNSGCPRGHIFIIHW